MAITILRKVSASAVGPYVNLSNLVTPSTSAATSSPKSLAILWILKPVSSTVSCNRAAFIVGKSIPRSTKICATATGWVM